MTDETKHDESCGCCCEESSEKKGAQSTINDAAGKVQSTVNDATDKVVSELDKAVGTGEKNFLIAMILSIIPGIGLIYIRQLKYGLTFLVVEIVLWIIGWLLPGPFNWIVWVISLLIWLFQIYQTLVKYNEYKEYFDKNGKAPW